MKFQKSIVFTLALLVSIPAFAQKGPGQGSRPAAPQGPDRGRGGQQGPSRGRPEPQRQPDRGRPQPQPQRQPDYDRRRLDRRDRERLRRPPSRPTYDVRRNYGPTGPKGRYLPGLPGARFRYRPYADFRIRPYRTRIYYNRTLEAQILSEILDGIYRDQYTEIGSTFLSSSNDYDVIPSYDCVSAVRLHVKYEDVNIDHALITYWSPVTRTYESRTLEVNEYYEAGTWSSWRDLGLIGVNERVCVTEVTLVGETLSPRATQAEVEIYGRLY